MGPNTNTGKQIQSQAKTQAFYFDCSDPTVNFTDGVYATDIVLKNNSFIYYSAVKYFQNLAAYPVITVAIFDTTTSVNNILNSDTLPIGNTPDAYTRGNLVPGLGNVAANPTIGSCNNSNNCGVVVELTGITGSGITALSFVCVIMYVEVDI